jgi:mannitol-1-/sugar-/sorbitol-6-phosphatase
MTFEFDALLFDLDGTLISSIAAVDRAWSAWAVSRGFDPIVVLPKIHGRRSIDSVRALAPHLDAVAEDAWLRHLESTDLEGVYPLPGVVEFLERLTCPWAIVTSGTSDVAQARLRATGLPAATAAVYGETVPRGKPHPDPFLIGAELLSVAPERCVAFEDAAAGIRSAHAAGMRVIGLSTSLSAAQLSEADAVIADFTWLSLGPGNQFEIADQATAAM